MVTLKDFVTQASRPLPVIILADISGSMIEDRKIETLNASIKEMLEIFKDTKETRSEIHLMCIAFGGGRAYAHIPFLPAREITWQTMGAAGDTPMGAAFTKLTQLLENHEEIPGRSYRPTIVLISDGHPTDEWRQPLQKLLASPRAAKAFRMAMGIGKDADPNMLQQFVADPNQRIFSAADARDIQKFFRYVTMSVTSRSQSQHPDALPALPSMYDDLDELAF